MRCDMCAAAAMVVTDSEASSDAEESLEIADGMEVAPTVLHGLDGGVDGTGRGWFLKESYWHTGNNGRMYLKFTYPDQKPYYTDAGSAAQWSCVAGAWHYTGSDLRYERITDEEAVSFGLPPLPLLSPGSCCG